MNIYTKTGDKGMTSLFGGSRVLKSDLRIEAYGTIDELNAQMGLLRDNISQHIFRNELLKIQNQLFTIGSMLATNPDKKTLKNGKERLNIPLINTEDVFYLEHQIDKMNSSLPKMTHFIIPGGHPTVSLCHITRNVCRRAERRIVALSQDSFVNNTIIIYINRLSDYLFVLARKLSVENQVNEILWKPEKL